MRLDFNAPIQSVDLSRIDGRGDDTVAMVMACVSSWAQAAIDQPGDVRVVVRDEVWRSMRIPAMIRKIASDLRLSRSQGTIQMLSTHRLSDFEQVGDAGSEEVAIARSLIASCDTRVLLLQRLFRSCAAIGYFPPSATVGLAVGAAAAADANVQKATVTVAPTNAPISTSSHPGWPSSCES